MLPSDSVQERVEEMYGPERATAVLDQFRNAGETCGTETLVGQLCDQSLDAGLYLEIYEIDSPPRVVRLSIGEHVIGRGPDCDIPLHNRCTSRMHCLITVHADERITLRDLKSTNRVYVNGSIMEPDGRCELQVGARILASTICEMTLTRR